MAASDESQRRISRQARAIGTAKWTFRPPPETTRRALRAARADASLDRGMLLLG
jgi:hypothetical protein